MGAGCARGFRAACGAPSGQAVRFVDNEGPAALARCREGHRVFDAVQVLRLDRVPAGVFLDDKLVGDYAGDDPRQRLAGRETKFSRMVNFLSVGGLTCNQFATKMVRNMVKMLNMLISNSVPKMLWFL